MNRNQVVALGLILFVILFTFPVLMNLGRSVAQTQPPAFLQDQKAMQEMADKLGVKDIDEFRRRHKQVLAVLILPMLLAMAVAIILTLVAGKI